MSLYIKQLSSPLGNLKISAADSGEITSIVFVEENDFFPKTNDPEIPILIEAEKQLNEYFAGNRKDFNLKLSPEGTDFQKRVWQQLQTIPFGKTVSYQKMANDLGDPKVIRAAASANGKIPSLL